MNLRQSMNLRISKISGHEMNLLFVFCLSLFLLSCSKKQNYPHFLSVADTLVYSNPDSAVSLLKKMCILLRKNPGQYRCITVF